MSNETPKWSAGFSFLLGFTALAALVGGLGIWSVQARISGAVVAPGMIELESNRQVVQHLEGGVVEDILVRDGDVVEAGDVLVRLQAGSLRSERAVIRDQLREHLARIARLRAERDSADVIEFPDELTAAASYSAETQATIDGQRELFAARNASVERTDEQIGEQITQIENQIVGLESQYEALIEQRDILREDLDGRESLLDRGLIQRGQVTDQRRDLASINGEIGRIESDIARSRGEIAGLTIERLKLDTTRREEAISELRDLRASELELRERLRDLDETLDRLEIRAPMSGVVHGNQVFAVKSVIQAGQPIMYIIPQDQPLVVAVRLQPIHIDEVLVGQEAGLRFTAFDQRQTPEIDAHVSELSADVLTDETTGQSFYRVEIMPDDGQIERLGEQTLVPGMPVEAYIHTGERTPLAYLTKPLTDYFNRSMRE
jgi:HlyD family secretion protein